MDSGGGTDLAEFKQEKAEPRPIDFGRRASSETRTESIKIDPVNEARSATLFLMAGAVRPLSPCHPVVNVHHTVQVEATYLIKDETTNTVVPLAICPDDEDVTDKYQKMVGQRIGLITRQVHL